MGHLGMLLLGLLGFALLACAMDRHEHDIHGASLTPAGRRRLRLAGSAALVLSWVGLVHEMGGGIGTFVWLMLLSGCGLVVVLVTTYSPRWLGRLPH